MGPRDEYLLRAAEFGAMAQITPPSRVNGEGNSGLVIDFVLPPKGEPKPKPRPTPTPKPKP